MLEKLKEEVCEANKELVKHGLVIFTEGNVSAITEDRKHVLIKPSGVPYEGLTPDKIVVLDINGKIIEGTLNPSSDTPTHLEIYRNFKEVNSIAHTHSAYATAFAQAKKPILPLGTTHADAFYGEVPVTKDLTKEEINSDYELNTGKVIVERFRKYNLSEGDVPGCLVASHGVFVWGTSCEQCVHNAVVVEEIAKMAFMTKMLGSNVKPIDKCLLDKHFLRKHGKSAYYGQRKGLED